jgi:hypothetical protein
MTQFNHFLTLRKYKPHNNQLSSFINNLIWQRGEESMDAKVVYPQGNTDLAKILGISEELASTCLANGHIILMNDTRQTFIRLRDLFQVLRQNSGRRGLPANA